jgi:hypothetical protein
MPGADDLAWEAPASRPEPLDLDAVEVPAG